MRLIHPSSLPFLTALLLGAGCSMLKPKADLTQFYVLRATSGEPAADLGGNRTLPAIRLGPGNIPGYLENTPIAVLDGANQVKYLDLHHWAEPLAQGISRTVSERLVQSLEVPNIVVYPDPVTGDAALEIRYTIHRFEGDLSGAVTFDVSWQLVRSASGQVLAQSRSVYAVPSGGSRSQEVSGYIGRLSLALSRWVDDLATAIRSASGL